MLNLGGILYALGLLASVGGIVYCMTVIHVVMPWVIKKYGEDDLRTRAWKAKTDKLRRERALLLLGLSTVVCLIALVWIFYKAQFLFNH